MLKGTDFKIEVGDDGFQLVGPGEVESGVTDYGDTAEVEIDGATYVATMEDENEIPDIFLCLEGSPVIEEIDFETEDET